MSRRTWLGLLAVVGVFSSVMLRASDSAKPVAGNGHAPAAKAINTAATPTPTPTPTTPTTPAKPAGPAAGAAAPHADAGTKSVATKPSGASPASTPAASAPPASAPRQETLEEIVARVRRRLALEATKPSRKPAPPGAAPSPRVALVWRPSVVWPEDLVSSGSTGTTAPPATTDTQSTVPDASRVTLSWEPDAH